MVWCKTCTLRLHQEHTHVQPPRFARFILLNFLNRMGFRHCGGECDVTLTKLIYFVTDVFRLVFNLKKKHVIAKVHFGLVVKW